MWIFEPAHARTLLFARGKTIRTTAPVGITECISMYTILRSISTCCYVFIYHTRAMIYLSDC